jgi:2-dehydropantoate 2-reductase
MNIAIMGSGGVGGYFGARLAHAGCRVAFIARGAHLAALRQHGLTVESPLGNLHLPKVTAVDAPADVGHVDYVFVCVKLWDTEAALRSLLPLATPDTTLISFQNGVQKDADLERAFGRHAVMGGVAYIATSIARPGVITHVGTLQRLQFGEYDGVRSARGEALLEACRRAGIDAELSPDIRRAIWEKFVFLVGLSATTTVMRVPIGEVRAHPQARAFLLDVVREAVVVARAHGVGFPADYAEQRLAFFDSLPHEMTSSMHHDLERGKPLEVAWLSGAVVDLAQAAGIDTPANRAVRDILAVHAGGRRD